MNAIPDDIMRLARKAIMAEVRPEVRWQYADGRCDHFAVVQAVAKAIYAERERSALVAKSHSVLVPVCDGEKWMHVANAVALTISHEILNSSEKATVMDRATETSFEAGSAAAENAREVSQQRLDDGSVSHAGAGESPATNSLSSASPASQAADEKAVPPFNKRGTALLSSEGGDEE